MYWNESCGKGKYFFDFVIDGANVGYHRQNFANAPEHVDYLQIDWMVDHLCTLGKSVLLILHERHFSPKLMPKWAEPIRKKWDNKGIVFCSPGGANDDWFWMHAALWCGRVAMVVSNDEMRDHHFQMLAYRSFMRWKERHQVHYTFGEYLNKYNDNIKRREVILIFPDLYSRCIQRSRDHTLVIPLPRKSDLFCHSNDYFERGNSIPDDESYVCIALNK